MSASAFERSMGHRMRFVLLAAVCLMGSVLGGGCSCDPLAKAVEQLELARQEIRASRKSAVGAIDRLSKNLPEEVRSTIQVELDALAQNAIKAAGVEGRCNVDHIADRMDAFIQRLIDRINHEAFEMPPPTICSVYPSKIPYLHLVNSRIYSIDFYGYDLRTDQDRDERDLELLVENNDGSVVDMSRFLDCSTTYQGVINLGLNGVPIDDATRALVIRAEGMNDTMIPIIHLRPKIERGRIESCEQLLRCTNIGVWGDHEFGGHGPCWFEFIAQLRHNAQTNKLETRIHLACVECNGNWTGHGDISWCRGWSDWVSQTPSPIPGKFVRILSDRHQGPRDDSEAELIKHRLQRARCETVCTEYLGDGGLVNRYNYWGDHGGGDDRIAHTRAIAFFNPIEYEYIATTLALDDAYWDLLKRIRLERWPEDETHFSRDQIENFAK